MSKNLKDKQAKEVNERKTLNEIFAPFQKQIEEQGVSEEEIDDLVKRARREVFAEKKAENP